MPRAKAFGNNKYVTFVNNMKIYNSADITIKNQNTQLTVTTESVSISSYTCMSGDWLGSYIHTITEGYHTTQNFGDRQLWQIKCKTLADWLLRITYSA